MAYADQKMSSSRIVALIIVAVIHAVLGYAFVTGLAFQYVKEASEKLNTFDVEEPPPPPDEVPPPPPPPDQPMQPPPVVTPPAMVPLPVPAPTIQSVDTPPPSAPPVPIAAPPAAPPAPPPPPPPPRVSQAARARGNVGRFFGRDAYPPAALREGAQGRVAARLQVGPDGRVTACSVTASSGNSDLDDTTCRIARSRVRYDPAKDDAGNPIASTVPLAVRWTLEE